MNINELCEDETCDAIVQLVKNCPLLAVEKGVNSVLLDLVELVFHPGIVAELMALGSKGDDQVNDKNTNEEVQDGIFYYSKPSPVPLHVKHPERINSTIAFVYIKNHIAHAKMSASSYQI